MSIQLDRSQGGLDIAEIEFNMADFNFGEYKNIRLLMKKTQINDIIEISEDTYLDIGLKGTRSDGLQIRKQNTSR